MMNNLIYFSEMNGLPVVVAVATIANYWTADAEKNANE